MNYEMLTKKRSTVPVFHSDGKQVAEIKLPEPIVPLYGKRGGFTASGNKTGMDVYYKGAGVIYQGHMVNEQSSGLKLIREMNIVYEKYHVCYPNLMGKYGIFLFRHQPVFGDLEGGCGKKEQNLLVNQQKFELSAIEEITDVISTGIPEHNIYAYRLRNVSASPMDVIHLIEYILRENYNTAWDKNLWSDIYCFQYVRDLADWFISDQLCHKLGTIYALFRSIYDQDLYLYTRLLNEMLGVYNCERNFVLYFSALVVHKFCPELFLHMEYDITRPTANLYEKLLHLLFEGKACCHLEQDEKWNWVREYHVERIERYVKVFQRRLAGIGI